MLIGEIMTKDFITIRPDASLKDLGTLFKEKKINGLPVVDEKDALVGVVTMTDMLKILDSIYTWRVLKLRADGHIDLSSWHQEEKLKSIVKNIMTKEVYTLNEQSTIEDLMRLVFTKNIHTIPVLREGKLIGVVEMRDLVYACF